MTINYTALLGLAEPVTGTASGTWGDDVNKGITDYLDIAIAGTQAITSNQTAVTLDVTNGSAAGNGILQVGAGTTGSSQYQIINCTGAPASTLTITAPAASKSYLVINDTATDQDVKLVGVGPTTGVTLVAGEKAVVAWNGTDFTKIANSIVGANPVTAVSVATDNGFAGTSSGGETPVLTIETTVTGLLKGDGEAVSAATANTDYLTPPSGTALLKAGSGGALANAVAGTDYVSPTGTETLSNKTLTNPTVTNYVETPYIANTTTAITISLANGTVQILTVTDNATITMPTATAGKSFIVYLNTGAGGFTTAFTGVKWPSAVTPVITSTASRMDIYSFFADGTNWYGVIVGQNYTP